MDCKQTQTDMHSRRCWTRTDGVRGGRELSRRNRSIRQTIRAVNRRINLVCESTLLDQQHCCNATSHSLRRTRLVSYLTLVRSPSHSTAMLSPLTWLFLLSLLQTNFIMNFLLLTCLSEFYSSRFTCSPNWHTGRTAHQVSHTSLLCYCSDVNKGKLRRLLHLNSRPIVAQQQHCTMSKQRFSELSETSSRRIQNGGARQRPTQPT